MGRASNLWQRLVHAPDPRSEREVAGDIDAELAFHLEQREREFVAKGMSLEAAHEEALRQFGNVERVRAECRRVQSGGRFMLQRVTLVLLVLLLGVVAWLSFQSVTSQRKAAAEIAALHVEISQLMHAVDRNPAAPTQQVLPERRINLGADSLVFMSHRNRPEVLSEEATGNDEWEKRFQDDASKGIRTDKRARSLAKDCSELRTTEVLQSIWPKLDGAQRRTLLDVLVDARGEWLARHVVHLAATDPDTDLARRAFELLRELTFVRFDVARRDEYLAWYAASKDLGLTEIVEKTAPALVKELQGFGAWNGTCALYSPLNLHMGIAGSAGYAEYLRDGGALQLIQAWARDPDPKAQVAAVRWLEAAQVDEVTARMILMPLLADGATRDPALVPAICQALISLECTWAWEPLLAELGKVMRTNNPDPEQLKPISEALGRGVDHGQDALREVPTVLAWLVHANSPAANEILGDPALLELTGVAFDPSHDAAWWLNWWSINRATYPNSADTENGLPRVE